MQDILFELLIVVGYCPVHARDINKPATQEQTAPMSSLCFGLGGLTLALTCCRKPQRGTSVATVLIVKGALYIFLVLHLLGFPGCPMLQHGIENGQKLMHARRQGDFFDFPRREEPCVKDANLRVKARGHQRAHEIGRASCRERV